MIEPWQNEQQWRSDGVLMDALDPLLPAFGKQPLFDADVIVVGTGSGGATTARYLARGGFKVLMVDSGPFLTAQDFNGSDNLYLKLYKNGLLHSTHDGDINLLQGECVGGSATINWTSSFRLPSNVLDYWQAHFGLTGLHYTELASAFNEMEALTGVAPWTAPPNENNAMLAAGAKKLGWHFGAVPRNVKGCWDLGFCGLGCPTNAKQSPLVTSVPDVLAHGGALLYNAPVVRVLHDGNRAHGVVLKNGLALKARHLVLAAGAINTPGLLLSSGLQPQMPNVGRRTFLHPSCFSLARFHQDINPFYGAPQSVYSDQFLVAPDSYNANRMAFKLEAVPLQPVLAAGLFAQHGKALTVDMGQLANTQGMIALLRDGFGDDTGGVVKLDRQQARLSYPVSERLKASAKQALLEMARCQFAAGAYEVRPACLSATQWFQSFDKLSHFLSTTSFRQYDLTLGSAHLMGGCGLGDAAHGAVVDAQGFALGLGQLSIVDASVFPTSLGVNPQLTIMAFSRIFARHIEKRLQTAA